MQLTSTLGGRGAARATTASAAVAPAAGAPAAGAPAAGNGGSHDRRTGPTPVEEMTRGRPPGRRAWQQDPLSRCQGLRALWATVKGEAATSPPVSTEVDEVFASLLATVEESCERPVRREGLLGGISGVAVERVWTRVHEAEVLLVRHSPVDQTRAWVEDQVRSNLDPETRQYKMFGPPGSGPKATSSGGGALTSFQLANALQSAHSASAAQHRRVRSFRNTMYAASLVVLAAVGGLLLLAWRIKEAVPLCAPGSPARCLVGTTSDVSDVAVAAVLGAVGGVLSGIPSLRRMRGTSTPYSVPTALWLFKAPCGALSAIVGLLLLQTAIAAGAFDTIGSSGLLATALVFGASQQLVTRLADRQGQAVLRSVRSGTGNRRKRRGR